MIAPWQWLTPDTPQITGENHETRYHAGAGRLGGDDVVRAGAGRSWWRPRRRRPRRWRRARRWRLWRRGHVAPLAVDWPIAIARRRRTPSVAAEPRGQPAFHRRTSWHWRTSGHRRASWHRRASGHWRCCSTRHGRPTRNWRGCSSRYCRATRDRSDHAAGDGTRGTPHRGRLEQFPGHATPLYRCDWRHRCRRRRWCCGRFSA